MNNRKKRRGALDAERLRDELATREAEQARPRVKLRPDERITVRILDETNKGNSTETESNHG